MIKQIFIMTAWMLALSACGSETPLPATEPAQPTQSFAPLTQTPAPTETTAPTVEIPTPADAIATATRSTPAAVSFMNDIQPILNARCIKCHGVEQTKEGLDLRTYESIFAGSRNGSVIEPTNAADSLLVQLIVEGEMPNRGDPVTSAELQLIIDWVNQGALNN